MAARTPCIVGAARRTWHPAEADAPEPLAMWEEVARLAADDAGAPGALARIERLDVVYCQAWQYDDPPARLAARLGASPAAATYSGIGGSVPLTIVSDAGEAIARGDLDLCLLVGAEALATVRRLGKAGAKPEWSYPPDEARPFPFDVPYHRAELAHRMTPAYLTFALFDSARRHHLGRSWDEHRRDLGRLLAPMSAIAAGDPEHAWFPVAHSPDELVTPSPTNRMVAYPFTKLMTAFMDVDMAAAVLLASDEMADRLGVAPERRVYLRGSGYAEDPPHLGQRRELWRSPAMAVASRAALAGAGAAFDDVAHLDLYSCFASSLEFAADALGTDPAGFGADRPPTVTGGLPFHGGPGSDYVTHSLAAMTEVLRGDPGSLGLVSGVGMHMVKHAFGLWSTEPGPFRPGDRTARVAGQLDVHDVHDVRGDPVEGPATVAAYTVLHGRDGRPEWAALICDVEGGRCYARLEDPDLLALAEREDAVGWTVQLSPLDGGVNLARR